MILTGSLKRHRDFIGNVATMMTGKSVAAAIGLLTMPVVARLFSPEHFGVAATYLSIVGIVSNVSSLRYERAIVLPRHDEEARTVMGLSYWTLIACCLFMLALLGIYWSSGMSVASLELLGVWMWLLPLGVLLSGGLYVQEQWLTREKKFQLSAASIAVGSGVTGGTRIAFGLMSGTSVFGLIVGNLLGLVVRIVMQRAASFRGALATFGNFDLASMRNVARQYIDFPKLNAPAGLIFAMGQNLPVLFFGAMFSPAIAGYYAMANRLSKVPTEVVANSMRRVFFQKAAAITNRERSLYKAFLLSTSALAAIGVVPFGCLWLFGQPLLVLLLGDEWSEAGRFLEIMAPWLFMVWVTAPANPVFVALRMQKAWLMLQSWLTVLRLFSFGVAYLASVDAATALHWFVIATVAGNLVTIGSAFYFISRSPGASTPAAGPYDSE